MMKRLLFFFILLFPAISVAGELPRLAIVPGGEPNPTALLAICEAKLFELKNVELLERQEIDKVFAEQNLSGMFDVTNTVMLGAILKTDFFAVLESTSIIVFDAKTGLRYADETLPVTSSGGIDDAANLAVETVKTAIEKRDKLGNGTLATFGILEIRNAEFPADRNVWCEAVSGMLERVLLHRGASVLERSWLEHVSKERQLIGEQDHSLFASMQLINLEFTRSETADAFLLNVHIGEKTFKTEAPFRMPQNAVNDAVNKILEQNPDEKSTSLQDEAARFYNEAVFLYENKLYDQAAKYIETAYALNPENEEYRDTLLEYLFEDAYILLMQNVTAGYADRSFLNKDPIKTKRSISVFRRAFDIYSREQKFMTLSTTRGPQTMDYNRYLNVIMHIPQDIYPEWISDREKIFQQVFDDWINVRYPRLKDSVYDQKSFSLWASPGLVSPPERIRNYAPLDVVANCYETFFRDLFAFQKQYQMNPDNVKPILDQFQKFAIYVLSLDNVVDQRFYGPIERPIWQGIAGFTGSLPVTTKPSEREKSLAEASIRRTFTLISGQGFDIYVWVTELRVREQHRRTTVHTEEERNELANACIQEIQNKIMSIPDGIESRDREILSKMLLERKEMLERIMGTKPPEKQPETPNEFLAARELPVQNAPWKEKRLLSHLHIHPSLHARNDTLVVFEDMYDNGETVKPHLFNLKTFEQTTLPEWKIEKSENSQVGKSSDVIRGCDLDDKNIYVSRNGHGIFIFPRDGGRPTVINTKNGLPHNFIQSFAVLKDKLYAGVGLIGAESWFVEVDLQTQKVTLLSSSLGKTGTAPFFNLSPPPRFHKFTPDPKHHRILFTVQADNENPKNGLWTVDENKTFEQILAFETFDSFFSDRLSISPDGKYLFLVSYKGAPALFDLEIKKQVQLDRLNNQWLQKLQSGMNPPAFSPREFYRGWSYGLISLDWEKQCLGRVFIEDPTRIERLDIVCSRPYYAFGVMLAVPNGIVVIGDPNQFFFLRFE